MLGWKREKKEKAKRMFESGFEQWVYDPKCSGIKDCIMRWWLNYSAKGSKVSTVLEWAPWKYLVWKNWGLAMYLQVSGYLHPVYLSPRRWQQRKIYCWIKLKKLQKELQVPENVADSLPLHWAVRHWKTSLTLPKHRCVCHPGRLHCLVLGTYSVFARGRAKRPRLPTRGARSPLCYFLHFLNL